MTRVKEHGEKDIANQALEVIRLNNNDCSAKEMIIGEKIICFDWLELCG